MPGDSGTLVSGRYSVSGQSAGKVARYSRVSRLNSRRYLAGNFSKPDGHVAVRIML